MKKNKKPYTIFAKFYDSIMNKERYKNWEKLVKETVKKYGIKKGIAVDLACGTGKTSRILADLGFKTIGIDNSKEMLRMAKSNFPNIKFLNQDMAKFNLPNNKRAIFIIYFYDSLNYLLTSQKVLAMLKSVENGILPGGVFLFDCNTKAHILNCQRKPTQAFFIDETKIIFENSGKEDIWEINLSFFSKNGKLLAKEQHKERGYNEQEIKKLLGKTSFHILDIKKEKSHNGKRAKRFYFIVQKPCSLKSEVINHGR